MEISETNSEYRSISETIRLSLFYLKNKFSPHLENCREVVKADVVDQSFRFRVQRFDKFERFFCDRLLEFDQVFCIEFQIVTTCCVC